MEAVIIPAGTVVQINGVPVRLPTDTLVETAYSNMSSLVGYHYAHVPESEAPIEAPSIGGEPGDK